MALVTEALEENRLVEVELLAIRLFMVVVDRVVLPKTWKKLLMVVLAKAAVVLAVLILG